MLTHLAVLCPTCVEPTTSLDSWTALDAMKSVRKLADAQMTIMCTIHQPSTAIYDLFDTLMLLSAGRVAYFGPAAEAGNFFMTSTHHFHLPAADSTSTAEFLLDVCGGHYQPGDDVVAKQAELADVFAASEQGRSVTLSVMSEVSKTNMFRSSSCEASVLTNTTATTTTTTSLISYHTPTMHQIATLCKRSALRTWKNPTAVTSYWIRHLIIALFYGSLYWNLGGGTDIAPYTNRLALIFYCLLFVMFSHIQQVAVAFENRLVFYRERAAGAYGAIPFFISSFVISIPAAVVNVLVFSGIIYSMAGLYPSADRFMFFFGSLFLCSLTGLFMCHLVANTCSSSQVSLTILPIFIFLAIMLSGYIVLIPDLPLVIRVWAPYCSFMRWSFQALVLNEFIDNSELPLGSFYIADFDFSAPGKDTCLGILFCFTIAFMVLCLGTLKYINFEKR